MENVRYIDLLKNKHMGSDIWVLGSGASLNYVEPSFFENKITIGLNHVGVKYKITYAFLKDMVKNGFSELPNCSNPPFNSDYIIASEWDKGGLGSKLNTDPTLNPVYAKYMDKFYFFKHIKNGFGNMSVVHKDSDEMFISTSTITSAVHLAGYMGAKNIMICGHDILAIDGKLFFDEYTNKSSVVWQDFMINRDIRNDTVMLRETMAEVYGTNVYTLNPFIGFDVEGHKYEKLGE